MKYIYKSIYDILINDSDLKSMVKYSTKNMNIRRGYQQILNTEDNLISFYLQQAYPKTDFTSQIRTVPLIIKIQSKENDLIIETISERIILLLDGSNLSIENKTFIYDIAYNGDILGSTWNEELKCWEKALRFVLIVRIDEVVGNSGYPTRHRN